MAASLSTAKADRGFRTQSRKRQIKVSWVRLDDYFTKGSVTLCWWIAQLSCVPSRMAYCSFPILFVFALLIGLVFSRYDAQFRSLDKGVLEIINGGQLLV